MSTRYVKIKSVRGQGFRTFADRFQVDFPEIGTVLIEGKNAHTGGSSGAGKSNLFLAIAYALGYCPYPATVLESWHTKAPMWVEVILDTHDGEVVLRRGSKLTMTVGGEAVVGGAKGVAERLNQILGLDVEMLAALTYRGQRKPGLFLRKTDGGKKEFLTTILGLDLFEAESDRASKLAAELKVQAEGKRSTANTVKGLLDQEAARLKGDNEIQALRDTLETHTQAIKKAEAMASEHGAQIAQLQRDRDTASQAAYAQEMTRTTLLEAQIRELGGQKFSVPEPSEEQVQAQTLLKECESRLTRLKQDDVARELDIRRRREALDNERARLMSCHTLIPVIQEKIGKLEAENSRLDAGTCPTCKQVWDKHAEQKAANLAQIQEYRSKLVQLEADKAKTQELAAQRDAIEPFAPNPMIDKMTTAQRQLSVKVATLDQQRKAQANEKTAEVAAKILNLQNEINQIRVEALQKSQAVTKEYQQSIDSLRQQATNISDAISASRAIVAAATQDIAANDIHIASHRDLTASYEKASSEAVTAEQRMAAETAFAKAVGREGFLGLIFDQILDEIADEATKILGSVANTQNVSISFRSENATQKNVMKREIKPILQIGDQEAVVFLSEGIPDCAGASGGMMATIELAVDLAVGKVVSQRAGFDPGWLILDESFNGLDTPSMEACMSILQEYGRDRLVLVIDHASEFKALFNQSIVISYDGQKSVPIRGTSSAIGTT